MWDTFLINPATNALLWIYNLLGHNFGIAIIVFTILIRVITWPLNASQMKSAKVMQDLQQDKDWQAIQKKYKDDKEKLAQEQMRVYQEKGINPFASCLPTLIQFPIIIGLYQALTRTLVVGPVGMLHLLRVINPSILDVNTLLPLNSQFLWMDLGRPESVNVFGFALPTLAIVVALTTYVQSKLTMPPPSGDPNDQSAMMGNTMSIYMPLMLGWFALTFASGLSVYFITSNLLGIVQYAAMGKANWSALLPGGGKKNQPAADTKKKK
jgi:YidC/Oxa1 family membrane protein insertase